MRLIVVKKFCQDHKNAYYIVCKICMHCINSFATETCMSEFFLVTNSEFILATLISKSVCH